MADGIKVAIRKDVTEAKESAKGHTYIHFGGALKERFKMLAESAGYTRKLNDFGVELFKQALTLAEADFARQVKEAQDKARK
jgi:hypothetical protein